MKWRKVMCNVLLILPVDVLAADIHYSIGSTLTHSTNLNHEPIPVNDELSQSVRGVVSAVENSASIVANVDMSVEAIHYTNNLASDSSNGQLLGNALWNIRPGMFAWYVSDVYTQTAIDTLVSDTPANRQNVNAFSTGPNYYLRINRRSNFELDGRLERYTYEDIIANNNNDRATTIAKLDYAFNPALNTNLNYQITYVTYDDQVINTDFSRNDVFLGAEYARGVNTVNMEAGYTSVNNYQINDVTASRYLVSLQNQRTRNTVIRAEYNRELSDSGIDVFNITTAGNPVVSVNSDLYVRTTSSVNMINTMSSGVLTINAHKIDSDYLSAVNLDQSLRAIYITNLWNLHRRSTLIFDGSYTQTRFQFINRIDDDYLYGMTYTYGITRHVNFDLRAEQVERQSTDLQYNFDDTRIILTLEYVSR